MVGKIRVFYNDTPSTVSRIDADFVSWTEHGLRIEATDKRTIFVPKEKLIRIEGENSE